MSVHLGFAPGTTDDCKKLVQKLPPADLFDAYRQGRHEFKTSDIVLVVAAQDHEIVSAWPRAEYVKGALSRNNPKQLATLTIASKSAHQVMLLPAESDAFWLVVEVKQMQFPIMCVLHAIRLEAKDGTILAIN